MFNADEYRERQKILDYGYSKWPDEKNVTKLYEMACQDLEVEPKLLSTRRVNHLPTPEESAKENPDSKITTLCPECRKKTYVLYPLCPGCKDAENGKYKVMFKCYECGHSEKSEEPTVVWLERFGIDFQMQTKASLGLKTITDTGLK
jgi:hypothetical protein